MKKILLFVVFLISFGFYAQQPDPFYQDSLQETLVDKLYKGMSLDEKIGQLFMMRIPSEFNEENKKIVDHYIHDLHMGGMGYLKGHPSGHLKMNNYIQSQSKIPVILAIDAEWGLAMRLDSVLPFPWFMTLGAIQNHSLIYQIGRRMGKQLQLLGYSMNYSPDVDINTNPDNPIIGNRSFGEDKNNVARKAYWIMKGMQDEQILTTAKHYPGHGDTSQDSHKTLPSVNFSYERIDSVELYPYKYLIPKGLTGVMVAHLRIPALDYRGVPSTLSPKIIHDILKVKLGFKGIIMTDAMVMKGVSTFTEPEMADLMAFLAGNDVILFSKDPDKSIAFFKEAYRKGIITEERLAESVKKILKAKMWAGLFDYQNKALENVRLISTRKDTVLTIKAYEEAVTLVKNNNNLLPYRDINARYAYIPMGEEKNRDTEFYKMLKKYVEADRIEKVDTTRSDWLKKYDYFIVPVFKNTSNPWKSYKISEADRKTILWLSKQKPVALIIFTSPYALKDFPEDLAADAVVVAYQNNEFTRSIVPQQLFGALPFKGKLPVSINKSFNVNSGILLLKKDRLAYGLPELEGMDSKKLARVDSLMQFMLDTMAAPGAVVLAARNGRIVFHKVYGYKTYDSKEPLHPDDVFDLASVTKVISATLSMMRLYDEGYYKLTDRLGDLLPYLKGSNKDTLQLIAVLSHYAQLTPWIPFYKSTMDSSGNLLTQYYRRTKQPGYEIKVAENLYLINSYPDTIWQKIKESPLREKKEYKYSGLFFLLWKKYMQDKLGTDLDRYNDSVFYHSIGAKSLTYNAWKKFSKEKIVPSEIDRYWRRQELRGYVHDMAAAMLNGVSGNAGLFGNAEDLAKMMQMMLNNGTYGGVRYLKAETVKEFTKRHFAQDSVRRGLGWDKPQFKGHLGPTFEEISPESYGHQGFTGTMVWADPEEQLIYVFLSNRTYPAMDNRLLYELNIRSEVQRLIYLAIKNPKYDYRDQYKLKGVPYPWEDEKQTK